MAVVKIGPQPQTGRSLCPMLKEISQRKHHTDIVFIGDDDEVPAHQFVVAAQSKFLKQLLLGESRSRQKQKDFDEKFEVRLPGIKHVHLKRALKFMYTGQLKMTKQEIEKNHMVWHVNHILIDLFKVSGFDFCLYVYLYYILSFS